MAARSPLDRALSANSLAMKELLPTPTNINPIHVPGPELLAFIRVQQWVADKLRVKLPLLHGIFVLVPSQQLQGQGDSGCSDAAAEHAAIPWRLRQVSAVEAPPGADPAAATVLLVGGGQVAAGAVKPGLLDEVPEHEYLCCELAQLQVSGELRALRVLDEAHVAWRLKVACQLDAAIQAYKQEQATALASSAREPQLLAEAAKAAVQSMRAILKQLPPPGWVDNEVLQHVELNPIVWPDPPDAPWTLLSAEEYNQLLQGAAAAWQQYVQHKLAAQPLQPLTDLVPWIPLPASDTCGQGDAEEVGACTTQSTQSSSESPSDLSAADSDGDSLQPRSQTAAVLVDANNVNGARRVSNSASSNHIPNPNRSFSPRPVHRCSAAGDSPSHAPLLPSTHALRHCTSQQGEDNVQQDMQQRSRQHGISQSVQRHSSDIRVCGRRSRGMTGRSRSHSTSRVRSRSRSTSRSRSPGRLRRSYNRSHRHSRSRRPVRRRRSYSRGSPPGRDRNTVSHNRRPTPAAPSPHPHPRVHPYAELLDELGRSLGHAIEANGGRLPLAAAVKCVPRSLAPLLLHYDSLVLQKLITDHLPDFVVVTGSRGGLFVEALPQRRSPVPVCRFWRPGNLAGCPRKARCPDRHDLGPRPGV